MKLITVILGLFVVLLASSLWHFTHLPEPPEDKSKRPPRVPIVAVGSQIAWNIAYVDGASEQQMLDVYSPPDVQNAPVVVYVHRGEWAKGDKSEVCYKPKLMNENGVVFVSVNYRLSGVAKHPAQVNDLAAALRWVRDNIADYGGSPKRITLMGHSAGCHIVSLLGLDPRPLATVGMTPGDLQSVVCWSGGAYDLPAKYEQGGMYHPYIEQNFGADEASQRDASPIEHVSEADPNVRFVFVSGEKGRATSIALSETMAKKIQAAGGRAESVLLEGKTHFTVDYECGMPNDPIDSAAVLLEIVCDATVEG